MLNLQKFNNRIKTKIIRVNVKKSILHVHILQKVTIYFNDKINEGGFIININLLVSSLSMYNNLEFLRWDFNTIGHMSNIFYYEM